MELNFPKIEEKILKFWQDNKIFEKSLEKTRNKPRFVFYEGPPFANGLPGIHHLLARVFKDVVLRYKTMSGFFVERKAGWDTHGLPTEMETEKKLKIKDKKEIEKNIDRFIKECRNNVFTYKKEWEEFTERIGYWLDLKNAYITCSNKYIESLWWILKQIWDKGLLYQDYKVVPYCPRCGTSLSSHEVAQGYKTLKENSIYLKFPVKGENNTYFFVWTTTPWTLLGNVAIAVNPKFTYIKAKVENDTFILAKERLSVLGKEYKIINELKGKDLLGLEYEPLFNFNKPDKKAWFVISGDFVSIDEGTGLVHIAPAFGEDDMEVGKKNNLPVILNVDEEGEFKKEVKNWAGMFVKKADPLIIEDLRKRNLLFKEELYEHEYPFCWRCDSPLLYYAKQSWFIKVTEIKEELIKNNEKINWVPANLKKGRFGEWLKEVKDWNLSRERYWGTPLPVWQCAKCNKIICLGSIKELREKAKISSEINDLHRPYIDKIILKCDCSGKMKRVPEVIDCWFDSGAMPFAQWHYPFENQSRIDKGEFFPADFICEGVDQTRGWFYTLLVISNLLDLGISYQNVISHGIVLDDKGQKMSKSKGNVVRPSLIIEKYGADTARWYFYTVNQPGDAKLFSEREVSDCLRRFIMTFWNCYLFLQTYKVNLKSQIKSQNLLDKWVISRLNKLIQVVTQKLDEYDVTFAARAIENFVIDDLSQWYIRRSRKRFQTKEQLKEVSQTLYFVLLTLSKLTAPFIPFLSEEIYKNLTKKQSVHLEEWPKVNKELIDEKLEKKMEKVRELVALVLAERAKAGIKVRQPLNELRITNYELKREKELLDLIKEEVNVKNITFGKTLKLDTKITPELKEEGMVREVIRQIQEMRKRAGLKPRDKIQVFYLGSPDLNKILVKNKKSILEKAKVKDLILKEELKKVSLEKKEIKVDQKNLWLVIKKI